MVREKVHGAIFTRGPKDLHRTAIFIGGSNVAMGEKLLAEVLQAHAAAVRSVRVGAARSQRGEHDGGGGGAGGGATPRPQDGEGPGAGRHGAAWGGAWRCCWRGRGRKFASARGTAKPGRAGRRVHPRRRFPRRSWRPSPPTRPAICRWLWPAERWSSRPARPASCCCRAPRAGMPDSPGDDRSQCGAAVGHRRRRRHRQGRRTQWRSRLRRRRRRRYSR